MPELFTLHTIEQAVARLAHHLAPLGRSERVALAAALDRVTAMELRAPVDLPAFARSTMDGFAVRAADTYGAGEGLPAYLELCGEVAMGRPAELLVAPGTAARVHTGGMLPPGSDAVVMVEQTQQLDARLIEVLRPVAVGENVIPLGEDVRSGALLFPTGHWLRPQDLGGLAGVGITALAVAARPRVAILATGDEVVPPECGPAPGQVRDINSTTIAGLCLRSGALPLPQGIAPDEPVALGRLAAAALEAADVLIISAGSSVSTRDLTAQVIDGLGRPGVLVHGVAMHPGKPTILAVAGGRPVFGLPGNPVSTVVAFALFVAPALARLQGRQPLVRRYVQAHLAHNVASHAGSDDFVPVRLAERDGATWAEPLFGKSGQIYTLAHADGLLHIPLDRGGLYAGELGAVWLLE